VIRTELDKVHEVLSHSGIGTGSDNYPGSNGGARRQASSAGTPGGSGGSNTKPIPTGPRAQKRPRMSSTRVSQSPRQASKGLPAVRQGSLSPRRNVNNSSSNVASSSSFVGPSRTESNEEDMRRVRRASPTDWERDRDRDRDRERSRDHHLSPPLPPASYQHREWDRDRDRDRDRERDKEREKDKDRKSNREKETDKEVEKATTTTSTTARENEQFTADSNTSIASPF